MEDGLMDREEREALEMTKDELDALIAKGEPAQVARTAPKRIGAKKRDLNQIAAGIVAKATTGALSGPDVGFVLSEEIPDVSGNNIGPLQQPEPVQIQPSKTVKVSP
jgi:hypothetical protein